jgi:hypothetical protein
VTESLLTIHSYHTDFFASSQNVGQRYTIYELASHYVDEEFTIVYCLVYTLKLAVSYEVDHR